MATTSTRDYLLDQARRRLTTPMLSIPGMGDGTLEHQRTDNSLFPEE